MSQNLQLEDGGSEQNNTLQDELVRVSPLTKNELESIVIRTLPLVIEPIIEKVVRKVVKERIELAQEEILSILKQNFENSTSGSRSLELRFLDKVFVPVLTGEEIKGAEGTYIGVALFDGLTEKIVNSGPEASAKVEIVVLDGASDGGEGENWTPEDFDSKIVRERKGKQSLLAGSLHLHLNEGRVVLGDVKFRQYQSWTKISKFRLGARVVGNFNGTRVREAKTESFTIKDRRNTRHKKHDPPSLSDDVWRLENISKDGAHHKRLAGASIGTVKHFLTSLFTNPERLQNILGMSGKKWKALESHAQRCKIDDEKVYLYKSPGFEHSTFVVFNVVGRLLGLLLECQYVPIDKLSETEKAAAQRSVGSAFEHQGSAFEHREDVLFFDDETYLAHGYFPLLNASNSSNLPRLESPNGHNFGTYEMIVGCDHTQPSTSTQGIEEMNNFGGCSSPNVDYMDLMYGDLLFLNNDFHLQSENPGVESHADLQTDTCCMPDVEAQSVPIRKAQKRGWTIFVSLLRWFSVKRIIASSGVRDPRRQRLCE